MARFTLQSVADFDAPDFASLQMTIEDADALGLTDYEVVLRDPQDTDTQAALDYTCTHESDETIDAFIHANASRLYASVYPNEIALALFNPDIIGKTIEIHTL